MSNSLATSLAEKPPFNIHDALCGKHDLLYGQGKTVEDIISKAGNKARILDFRSASGQWALDAANRFSVTQVVGVDDKDPSPVLPTPFPPNLTFKRVPPIVDNVIPDIEGDFDVIHARAASATVNDFSVYITTFVQKLRPGGILLLTSGELGIFDEKGVEIKDSGSYKILQELFAYQSDKGMDMKSMYQWKQTLTTIGSELNISLDIQQDQLTLPFKKDLSFTGPNYTAAFMGDTVNFFSKIISAITPDIRQKALDELRALDSNEGILAGAHLRWQFAYAIRESSS